MILNPNAENITRAASELRNGNLVIIPTETVYGLAALALDPAAVAKIFEAKGRPATNPLIVHIAEASQAADLAEVNHAAFAILSSRFWPGPLTMVLPKKDNVPDVTTGGLDTVAVRVPNHPVALALLTEVGAPLAAPSANRYTALSPSKVQHLDAQLLEIVALVIDGGPCRIGIESTVVDLSGEGVKVLRPGMISAAEIAVALGEKVDSHADSPLSPGHSQKHYAPRTKVSITTDLGSKPGLSFGEPQNETQIQMPSDPAAYAQELYDSLATMDQFALPEFFIVAPPETAEWHAIWDRLRKAVSSD